MTTYKDKLDKAYYEGKPLVSNEVYDEMYGESSVVGAQVQGKTADHLFQMYSLQKYYPDEKTRPLYDYPGLIASSPKLDGAAVSLEYRLGEFGFGLTRGDGITGQIITDKMWYLAPRNIMHDGAMQVVGEVVALSSVPNSRNAASGALNLKDEDEFLERITTLGLKFIAYGVKINKGMSGVTDDYISDMKYLSSLGFSTVLDQDWREYPQDGVVYRVINNADFFAMGYTSKHPRGAYALKERSEGVVTELLDVEWNCGKSGKVVPTAILEPVMIGDALVSRATLNNIGFIKELGLEIGCKVKVIRSGEIIPCIVSRV